MANNTQKLTVAGTLPDLAPGASSTVTHGLSDGNTAIDANQVVVSNGLAYTINNAASPKTVDFFNLSPIQISAATFKISQDHSIQTQYPIPSPTTIGAAVPAISSLANGLFEAWTSVAQAATPAGTPTLVTLANSQNYGSASSGVSLAANLLTFATTATAKNWLVTASVSVSSAAAELVTLQLTQDPAGAATVLSQARATTAAGGAVNLTVQAVVQVVPLSSPVLGLYINSPAGLLSVNLGLTKGTHVTVQTL